MATQLGIVALSGEVEGDVVPLPPRALIPLCLLSLSPPRSYFERHDVQLWHVLEGDAQMRGWRVVGFSYADKGELQPKGTRALRGWAGSGAGGQCCLRAETRGTGTSVSCPSSPRASPGADVPPRPLSRQEAACFRLMARDEFTFEEARIWTNMGQVLSGAGSAASAQNSGVVFFTGSLQGYLYFS